MTFEEWWTATEYWGDSDDPNLAERAWHAGREHLVTMNDLYKASEEAHKMLIEAQGIVIDNQKQEIAGLRKELGK